MSCVKTKSTETDLVDKAEDPMHIGEHEAPAAPRPEGVVAS